MLEEEELDEDEWCDVCEDEELDFKEPESFEESLLLCEESLFDRLPEEEEDDDDDDDDERDEEDDDLEEEEDERPDDDEEDDDDSCRLFDG